jgi:hypothetical protein
MVVKLPHKIIFRTRNYGTPLFAFPSFAEGLLIIPVDLIPCHQARRPFNNQLFSDQMSSKSRSFLEQSRFSKSPCGEVIHHLSMLITSKPSELSQKVNSWSIETFAKLIFVAITNVECCTQSFSRSSPHHGQFFRPLDLIFLSVTTVWRSNATKPSSSATVLAPSRPHGLTIVELRVVYTRYPGWFRWPLQPTVALKGKPFTQNHRHKSLISVRDRHHHRSCSIPVRFWSPCH